MLRGSLLYDDVVWIHMLRDSFLFLWTQ
jgi:hypothetical protein